MEEEKIRGCCSFDGHLSVPLIFDQPGHRVTAEMPPVSEYLDLGVAHLLSLPLKSIMLMESILNIFHPCHDGKHPLDIRVGVLR